MLGNVDAGKSTLVGCLTRGMLDDGRGKARSFVLRHQHELKRGQTSSVALALLGYREGEQIMPASQSVEAARKSHNKDFYEVASKATHRVTLVDLCGHEKYLKSSIYGLTAMNPDCAMVVIGAERGIQRMTREHVGLCCALRIPFFIVETKIDMVPENVLRETQMRIRRILKRAGRRGFYVREESDLDGAIKCMDTNQVALAPVFEVSSVTGQHMDLLREFIKRMALRKSRTSPSLGKPTPSLERDGDTKTTGKKDDLARNADDDDEEAKAGPADGEGGAIVVSPLGDDGVAMTPQTPAAANGVAISAAQSAATSLNFMLDDVFNVPGVGIVVGGTVARGEAHLGQRIWIGPDKAGSFRQVVIRSIHRQCVPSQAAFEGQHATLAVKSVGRTTLKRDSFRKGMVGVGEPDHAAALAQTVWEFEADVKVLHHSTTIDRGYSPFIHLAGVRQSARIVQILSDKGEEVLARTGSQVFVRFRFLHCAEYLEIGRPLIFREGNAKGCGRITRLFRENGDEVKIS
ncbi:GTP-binding protein 1 [Hondaea fermentalgiana]|uniref:Elongation factor Tu, chloroplastic n=1 Tax=Hondaea fermentalgiana TaxID=2315210 RepID=A0A2R5GV54_9STRA|nr:GTP-binding protein 1 [Hondaea fermentalgiana]|eukprot:GBG34730.1 GTP-binding protein 1 [Hondaea fermentalgiana]